MTWIGPSFWINNNNKSKTMKTTTTIYHLLLTQFWPVRVLWLTIRTTTKTTTTTTTFLGCDSIELNLVIILTQIEVVVEVELEGYCWYGHISSGHMLPWQMPPWQLESDLDVPWNLLLNLGQNRVSANIEFVWFLMGGWVKNTVCQKKNCPQKLRPPKNRVQKVRSKSDQ